MFPASTSSPPNFFTPKRLECESRPLRVLPPAFLCAMRYLQNLRDDLRDLHIGVGLPMGLLALVMLAAAEFDNANLVALAVAFHGRDYLGSIDIRRADGHGRPGTDQQNLIEFDAGTLVGVELLDTHHGTFLNAVLFTARGDYGVHCCNSEGGQ